MYYKFSVLCLGVMGVMCLWGAEKELSIISWQGSIVVLSSLGVLVAWVEDIFTHRQPND